MSQSETSETNDGESNWIRERKEWSKIISIIAYIAFVLVVIVIIITAIEIFTSDLIGASHKNYIVGVVFLFFSCICVLLVATRDDSRSLIFVCIIAIAFSFLDLGIIIGQLIRHAKTH